jgi:hypothetical protein
MGEDADPIASLPESQWAIGWKMDKYNLPKEMRVLLISALARNEIREEVIIQFETLIRGSHL